MHMDEDCCQPIGVIDRITAQHVAQRGGMSRQAPELRLGAPTSSVIVPEMECGSNYHRYRSTAQHQRPTESVQLETKERDEETWKLQQH